MFSRRSLTFWIILLIMIITVCTPGFGAKNIFGLQSEIRPGVSPTNDILVDFSFNDAMPKALKQEILVTLNRNRESLPNVNEYIMTVWEQQGDWSRIVLVPKAVWASNWELPLVQEEIIEIYVQSLEIDQWSATIKNSSNLPVLVDEVPDALIEVDTVVTGTNYLFPWTAGQTWRVSQGWHYNAIDFFPLIKTTPSVHMAVLSAESGSSSVICEDPYQSQVMVNHGTVTTKYLHVDTSTIPSIVRNQSIQRGQLLGLTYNGTAFEDQNPACIGIPNLQFSTHCGCGKGPHVHFESTNRDITIDGHSLNTVGTNGGDYTSTNQRLGSSSVRSWNFANGLQGWTLKGMSLLEQTSNGIVLHVLENDPWLTSPTTSFSAASYPRFHLEMQSQTDSCGSLYFARQGEGFSDTRRVSFAVNPNGGLNTFDINMANHSLWSGTITNVRLDPACGPAYNNVVALIKLSFEPAFPLPSTPTNVSASDGTYVDKVRVSWSAVSGTGTYEIYRASTPGGTKTRLASVFGTSYDDTSVGTGVHYYSVRATNDWGSSSTSAENAGYKLTTPPVPTGVEASDAEFADKVHITWTGVYNAASYDVYRRMQIAGPARQATTVFTKIGESATPEYDDQTAAAGITYQYAVKAANTAGTSELSDYDSGSRLLIRAPSGVSASDGTYVNKIAVTWNARSGATGYEVFRADSPSDTPTKIGDSSASPYDDTTAVTGATYTYWVKTVQTEGVSPLSAPDDGYLLAPPGIPTDVNATDGTIADMVQITWTAVAGATSYKVYRGDSPVDTPFLIGEPTSALYDDTTAFSNYPFSYWVKAVNVAGASNFSESDSGYWNDIATGTHFDDCISGTGVNATVLIPEAVFFFESDALILSTNDEIAIFNQEGSICAGVLIWNGSAAAIRVWGDNPLTSNNDGMLLGEEFNFKYWDASEDVEYDIDEVSYKAEFPFQGTGIFNADILESVGWFAIYPVQEHVVEITEGWNLISTYIYPQTRNMSDVIQGYTGLVIVKNNDGQIFWPDYEINTIGDWAVEEGYYIYASAPFTLNILGMVADPNSTPIQLGQGWNTMSYLLETETVVSDTLVDLLNSIIIMKNGDGQVYWPEYGINSIGNMVPGQGYQVYMQQAETFIYPNP